MSYNYNFNFKPGNDDTLKEMMNNKKKLKKTTTVITDAAGNKYKIDPKTNKKIYVEEKMIATNRIDLPYAFELENEEENKTKENKKEKQDKLVMILIKEHNIRDALFKSDKRPKMKTMVELEGDVDWTSIHGVMGKKEWPMPFCVVECAEEARPGYKSMMAHEYVDHPFTLREKIKVLASLLKKSKNAIAYTGAGISTASGIGDYASKGQNSEGLKEGKTHLKNWKNGLLAEPNLGHRTLTQLFKHGYLKHWIQQNHDGLPQKAGFPQEHINEIHGAWFDPSNPVIAMQAPLRTDLYKWMCEWQKKADFTLAMGTSLCGMNADKCVTKPAKRYLNDQKGYGCCIVGLQRTALDKVSSIRIFAKSNTVMALLAEELKITIPICKKYAPKIPKECRIKEHVFRVPYDKNGNLTDKKKDWIVWDLTRGATIKVTGGCGKDFKGQIGGVFHPCHYKVHTPKQRETNKKMHGKGSVCYKMGAWWVETAVRGGWNKLPVVNTGKYLKLQSKYVVKRTKRELKKEIISLGGSIPKGAIEKNTLVEILAKLQKK